MNSRIENENTFQGKVAMLAEKAILARDQYQEQLRLALSRLAEAEQKHARTGENLLLSTTALADILVAWGSQIVESLTSDDDVDLADSQVRKMVSSCTEVVADFLQQAVDTDDDYSTRVFCEQAKKVADVLDLVHRSWHWADATKIEESWRQHRRGELMDFETFKNELLTSEE